MANSQSILLMPKGMSLTSTSNKRLGTAWEHTLHKLAQLNGWVSIKIPDGCRTIGKGRLIKTKSPFDFCLAKKGKVIFLDAKTNDHDTFRYSEVNKYQVTYLIALERTAQCAAGYIVYHRNHDKIVFYAAASLWNLRPESSLSFNDGIDLGSLSNLFLDRVVNLQSAAALVAK